MKTNPFLLEAATWDNSTGLSSGSGSSNTLTASTDGASVLLGDTMVPITFEYDAAVVEPQLLSRNMAMGHRTSCAIVENGSVACWGMGDNGQLGDGGQSNAIVPTLTNSMPGNMKAVAIDASTPWCVRFLRTGPSPVGAAVRTECLETESRTTW